MKKYTLIKIRRYFSTLQLIEPVGIKNSVHLPFRFSKYYNTMVKAEEIGATLRYKKFDTWTGREINYIRDDYDW